MKHSATKQQEIDLVLPMISPAERVEILRSFEDASFVITKKSDRLLESFGEVATYIGMGIASSALWDLIKLQTPKAIALIRGKLKKRKPIFQLIMRAEHVRTIYTLPTEGETEALEAIEVDFEVNPIDKDHRSWEAGEWVSAQRYMHDKDYAEQVRKKLRLQSNLKSKAVEPNPNANEPVFASPDTDLDPESDTGEPKGWS